MNYVLIFKLLTETESLPMNASVRFLMTCKRMYSYRKWYGNKRPLYKQICISNYQKKQEEKKKKFFDKTKVHRKKQKTEKAKKSYNQSKIPVFKTILQQLNKLLITDTDQYINALLNGNGKKTEIPLGSHTIKINKSFIHLLARKSVSRRFRNELSQFVSIQYPRLTFGSGPGMNNGIGYHQTYLLLCIWGNKKNFKKHKRGLCKMCGLHH